MEARCDVGVSPSYVETMEVGDETEDEDARMGMCERSVRREAS